AVSELEGGVEESLRGLATLDEDRIVRSMLAFIKAVVRTNFYHPTDGTLPTALAFKLLPEELSFLPLPRPQIETWVYSPRVEGAISTARGFWLGDAFASGGSNGYDHKEMGITS
ncbi:NAD-glutamate dehydrogenase domain-containing protein, partial [Brevibacterium paucivorans]